MTHRSYDATLVAIASSGSSRCATLPRFTQAAAGSLLEAGTPTEGWTGARAPEMADLYPVG